ncbi:MAG: ZIP family metal transporter [Flavobacteriaceae bacterium]|jgi:zinc transporter ZupT|nr:ZIP family metal transporter [Flavobacteriaceae bacterium]
MIIFLLISSVAIGIFLGKYFGKEEKFAKNLLIFSAGFLITICLNEVFPKVYVSQTKNIGLFVIAGVLLQVLLENLTKGFEHGHFHHHEERDIFPIALMIGLFVHAFIEGIPLANETEIFSPYLLGILVHNIPISFVLGVYLFRQKIKISAVFISILFALASPLGMFLGEYFNTDWQPYFLAIVGGIFLHISSVIIFESNKNHKMNWSKILLVIFGVLLGFLGHLLG